MNKENINIDVEHEDGQPLPYVFPYSKKEYPYILTMGFSRPFTKGNVFILFEAFPNALITPQGSVIVPRSRQDITGPLMKSLDAIDGLGLLGFSITKNPN